MIPLYLREPLMPSIKNTFQTVNQRYATLNRSNHVWRPLKSNKSSEEGYWKCVLCGSVTNHPTLNEPGERVEALTEEDRQACPPQK